MAPTADPEPRSASMTEPAASSSPHRWLVVAVHGVGDPGGQGTTLDNFAAALSEASADGPLRVVLDGAASVRHLPEGGQDEGSPSYLSTFPAHVREARLEGPAAQDGSRAVFAEVYWADLARAGEGVLGLLWSLYALAVR